MTVTVVVVYEAVRTLSAPSPTVRPAMRPDLRAMAHLHAAALPHGFFADLGEGFLRTYLRGFVDGPHAAALVVEHEGAVAGFVVGPTTNDAHWGWVLRNHGVRLTVAGARALLRRPRLLAHFLRTRSGRYARAVLRRLRHADGDAAGRAPTDDAEAAGPVVAVLTHVAVADVLRGRGSGRALVDAFVAACAAACVDEVRLVTLSQGGAGSFYTRMGWQALGERRGADGTLVQEFRVTSEEFPSP